MLGLQGLGGGGQGGGMGNTCNSVSTLKKILNKIVETPLPPKKDAGTPLTNVFLIVRITGMSSGPFQGGRVGFK